MVKKALLYFIKMRLFLERLEHFGHLDILVNNAGVMITRPNGLASKNTNSCEVINVPPDEQVWLWHKVI